ncbi:MAG: UDP-N-acetylmuramoyl-L-alanyl-D-glutamate--2,6-diaminopimelate ligase [Oscillospiraceae bacterium]|jgi:UDP-N-acetylmuramoyl-L-alanyl-D-glutamate--2,6-diaminopimelate ligase|nr:UDP-N-acetylmuramoyl-L-alanyl-D-glutamate--2,6-diaminopimelate ligase [Oscillospiraceae bacterium]
MRARELFSWYDGALPELPDVLGVTDDLTRVKPGWVFVCIKGARFDGHDNAAAALAQGAACVVVERDLGEEAQVQVPDTRAAFSVLCAAWHGNPAHQLHIVGITGTNGKTSTAFLVRDILEAAGHKVGLIGTVRAEIAHETVDGGGLTTPDALTLQALLRHMVDAGCDYCVMEVSSQALAQRRTAGLWFDAAIYTNLTQDHLDYHGNMRAYRAAKRCLFPSASLCVLNADDPESAYMAQSTQRRTVYYSLQRDGADYVAKNLSQSLDGTDLLAVTKGALARVHLRTPGRFSAQNAMAALACTVELGVPLETAAHALSQSRGIPGRLERVPTDTNYRVYIDYAHTPDALENVLTTLRECAPRRLLLLFGCGGDRDRAKRPLMGALAARLADEVVLTSDNPRSEDPQAIINEILAGCTKRRRHISVEPDRHRAIAQVLAKAGEGDIVLLAGKGHEDYQILAGGKIRLDEREVVRAALAS